jgi:type VI secretion system protein ImpL
MNRFWYFLTDRRVLAVVGLLALAAFLFLGARELQLALKWAVALLLLALLAAAVAWAVRRFMIRREARALQQALEQDAEQATLSVRAQDRGQTQALRERMLEAIQTIRSSRLGELTGGAALYELPWYLVIGNPAAGKSTAITQSGLNFPLAAGARGDALAVQGIGGTRNCDWFFTGDGILIDTAGRYSVHEEDRQEWLGFLGLLKKHRPKAPINGLLVCVSVAELTQGRPDAAIALAKRLRQRVQEITERLEVHAPLYLVFTKADLINGFNEFFEDFDRGERERIWGATLPYDIDGKPDASAQFARHFDELRDGLREITLARMSLRRGQALPTGVLSFPLEFAAIQPALAGFVATLFEDNPYQFQPVFRGFYFTSALQEGTVQDRAGEQVAQRFGLAAARARGVGDLALAGSGMFLKGLFHQVVFADRRLVRQFASRGKQRARTVVFGAAVLTLAVALSGWTWTYLGNRQLVQDVRADLEKAVKLQAERPDLAGRLQAMRVLQDRIEQMRAWRDDRPFGLGLGLYQGDTVLRKLELEYFAGLRQLMIEPVAQAIEGFLGEAQAQAGHWGPPGQSGQPGPLGKSVSVPAAAQAAASAPGGGPALAEAIKPPGAADVARPGQSRSRYVEASPTDPEEVYNALKTYLMLAERQRLEGPHLKDQLTRYWRSWLEAQRGSLPVEQMKREAESMISFVMQSLDAPAFPTVDNNLALVDNTRSLLKTVMQGKPAIERVYAVLRARAATRFAQVTVAGVVGEQGKLTVAGSQVVGGAYTRRAWDEYLDDAFKDASLGELQSNDWVLGTRSRDDASLSGSPGQIRQALTELYKTEYTREWRQFLQGIAVTAFGDFDTAVQHMNLLGDADQSPIRKLLATVHDETSWDNPTALNDRLARAGTGVVDWFKRTVLGRAPSGLGAQVNVNGPRLGLTMGPVGREFAGLHRLMVPREGSTGAPIDEYLKTLAAVRSRFHQIKNQGETGPAARKLMAATLEGSGSELVDAVRLVDEQMLAGQTDSLRSALRPLLVRPLQQSFAVLVAPTEQELNRTWAAQVLEPFRSTLSHRFPFDLQSRVEAVPQEIAKVFGPEGAVARFANESMGPLVNRRGDALAARTWLDLGLRLRPDFTAGYARWVAPLEGAAAAGGGAAASGPQTSFQILPQGAPGLLEYTVDIDGQVLRYRNTAPVWTPFVWPHAGGQPGARITGQTVEGRTVELLNVPGRFGLQRMLESAQRHKRADGSYDLSWSQGGATVTLQLRIISQSGGEAGGGGSGAAAVAQTGSLRGLQLPGQVAGVAATAVTAAASAEPAR